MSRGIPCGAAERSPLARRPRGSIRQGGANHASAGRRSPMWSSIPWCPTDRLPAKGVVRRINARAAPPRDGLLLPAAEAPPYTHGPDATRPSGWDRQGSPVGPSRSGAVPRRHRPAGGPRQRGPAPASSIRGLPCWSLVPVCRRRLLRVRIAQLPKQVTPGLIRLAPGGTDAEPKCPIRQIHPWPGTHGFEIRGVVGPGLRGKDLCVSSIGNGHFQQNKWTLSA